MSIGRASGVLTGLACTSKHAGRTREDGPEGPSFFCDAVDYCSLEQSLPMTRTEETRIFSLAEDDAELVAPAAPVADEGELDDIVSSVPVTSTRLPTLEVSSDCD